MYYTDFPHFPFPREPSRHKRILFGQPKGSVPTFTPTHTKWHILRRSQSWLYVIALCLCNVFQVMIKDAVPSYKKTLAGVPDQHDPIANAIKSEKMFLEVRLSINPLCVFPHALPGVKKRLRPPCALRSNVCSAVCATCCLFSAE